MFLEKKSMLSKNVFYLVKFLFKEMFSPFFLKSLKKKKKKKKNLSKKKCFYHVKKCFSKENVSKIFFFIF